MELSHRELSLVLFALEGSAGIESVKDPDQPCSPDDAACPILDLPFMPPLPPEQQLVRHLSKHLHESWVECGLIENIQAQDAAQMREVQGRLAGWRCEIELEAPDRRLLLDSIGKLPRAAWFSMPRTLWKLKKKLRTG